jgi:hypothetical protein
VINSVVSVECRKMMKMGDKMIVVTDDVDGEA